MTIEIENQYLLTDRFGRWPSFHDAEVIRARFERAGEDAPFMECDIHLYEMTSEIDPSEHYVLRNHTLVRLRFCNIGLEEFCGWNHQNVLFDLEIVPAEPSGAYDREDWPIEVILSSSYGCEGKLRCASVKVVKAEDWAA